MLAPDLCQQNSDDKTPCRATKKGLPFCTHVYIAGNSWNKWRALVETRIEMGWMDEMGVVHCHVWLPGRVARSGWMIPTCSTCGSLIHWITRMGVNKKNTNLEMVYTIYGDMGDGANGIVLPTLPENTDKNTILKPLTRHLSVQVPHFFSFFTGVGPWKVWKQWLWNCYVFVESMVVWSNVGYTWYI